ncbi:MAG: response regulator [Chloroflexota bacterium]
MSTDSIGKVLVVDDHPLFRGGLAKILAGKGVDVVGEAADGFEAVEAAERLRPDIVLMDLNMPRCGGLEATRMIGERLPDTRVVILTVSDLDEDLFAAIRAGADGYLLKNVDPDDLVHLLERIALGEAPISGAIASRLLAEFAVRLKEPGEPHAVPPTHVLTAREIEVLRCVASGSSNREVAAALAISENTVKNHLRSILEKLHLANRVQAVAYAIRQGMVQENVTPSEAS